METYQYIYLGLALLIWLLAYRFFGGRFVYSICKKNGIDWRTCQPEDKYQALMDKWAKGDFFKKE